MYGHVTGLMSSVCDSQPGQAQALVQVLSQLMLVIWES